MNYRRVYIPNSFVHIILVSYNRKPIFIENVKLLKEAFINSKKFFKYEIFAICILPNHIHMILYPENINEYPQIVTSIKYYFSHNIKVGVETPTYGYLNKREKGVFQRRFFEHTITTQEELNNHADYIHYNPVKHGYINKVQNWLFSSFHKFAKANFYDSNWGSSADIEHIKDLDFE